MADEKYEPGENILNMLREHSHNAFANSLPNVDKLFYNLFQFLLSKEPCLFVSYESDSEGDGGRETSLVGQRLLCPLAYTSVKVQEGHLLCTMEMSSRETCLGQVSV